MPPRQISLPVIVSLMSTADRTPMICVTMPSASSHVLSISGLVATNPTVPPSPPFATIGELSDPPVSSARDEPAGNTNVSDDDVPRPMSHALVLYGRRPAVTEDEVELSFANLEQDATTVSPAATEPVGEADFAAMSLPPLFAPSPSPRPLTPVSPIPDELVVDLVDADELSDAEGPSGSVFLPTMSRSGYNARYEAEDNKLARAGNEQHKSHKVSHSFMSAVFSLIFFSVHPAKRHAN
jgi:hypothetical protein